MNREALNDRTAQPGCVAPPAKPVNQFFVVVMSRSKLDRTFVLKPVAPESGSAGRGKGVGLTKDLAKANDFDADIECAIVTAGEWR
jgi:hypothetical protein